MLNNYKSDVSERSSGCIHTRNAFLFGDLGDGGLNDIGSTLSPLGVLDSSLAAAPLEAGIIGGRVAAEPLLGAVVMCSAVGAGTPLG